jgi:hypothetical protein
MKAQSIWISYDLGVKGDYPGLYNWLDIHHAKECGNSVAYLKYEFSSDLITEIKEDLKKNVELNKSDRIYLIFRKGNRLETIAGRFIEGNRKGSPWEGYAPQTGDSIDE